MSIHATTTTDFVSINIDQLASDFDLGLAALTDNLVTNIDGINSEDSQKRPDIKEFIEETQRTEEKSLRLLKSEKSYHKWSKISLWSAGIGGVGYFGARVPEYFLAIFYPDAAIITSTVVIASEALVFLGLVASGVSAFKEGRLKKERRALNLSTEESLSLRKFQSVITNIGKLVRANGHEGSSLGVNKIVKSCFKDISELPDKIKDHALPSTNLLASLVIRQLPDENPLKAEANKIAAMELSASSGSESTPPEGSFVNKGQESKPSLTGSFMASESNIRECWERLNAMIPDLFLDKLYVPGHDRVVRVIQSPS